MSNLIPHSERNKIARKVTARIVIVVCLALIVTGVLALLALTPAYVSVVIPRSELEKVAAGQRDRVASTTEDIATIARFKLLSQELKRMGEERAALTQALGAIEGTRPSGLALGNVFYRSGTPGTLVISGSVTKRDLVGTYRKALEQTNLFSNIAVPVASLVGTSEGDFTMTLTGTF